MLNRIFVGLAIVASIFVAAFGFFSVKPKIETIVEQRKTEKEGREKAERERDDTKKKLTNTENRLKSTEERLKTTTDEKNNALAEAKKQKERADKRDADYKEVLDQRDVARAELFVWTQIGVKPDEIKGMIKQIADLIKERETLNEENRILDRKRNQLQVKLDGLLKPDYVVPLPQELRGKVLAVDPKYDFVVLSFGEKQGALENGELLVNRNGQLIAKVRITSMKPDSCIANVIAGYRLHDLLEGDVVFPANN